MNEQGEVTRLLSEIRKGNAYAAEKLIPIVYDELRGMARRAMRRERPGHTLQPTALVHEAYMRLVDGSELAPENRAHFFALAARSMRLLLVDHARRKMAEKRGGEGRHKIELEDGFALTSQQGEEVLALHEALEHLQQLDVQQAQIVEMRYFAGNEISEIAQALGISERTVERELRTARLYLKRQLASTGLDLP